MVKRLNDAGIPATLHDERNVQKYWFISQPLAGIKVRVHKADYQKTKDLLEKWAARGKSLGGCDPLPGMRFLGSRLSAVHAEVYTSNVLRSAL